MFSWLAVLKGLLQLALIVADIVRERQLLSAGEDRHLAKDLAALADLLKIGQQVEAEMDKLSPKQVDDALKEDVR